MRITTYAFLAAGFALLTLPLAAQTYATGDTRTVSQPTIPTSVCQTLSAQFTSSAVDVNTPTTTDDTSRVQAALTACANTGKNVVLAASGSNNAFLTGRLTMAADENLVASSGVTLSAITSYTSQSELILINTASNGVYGTPVPLTVAPMSTPSPAHRVSCRLKAPPTSSCT